MERHEGAQFNLSNYILRSRFSNIFGPCLPSKLANKDLFKVILIHVLYIVLTVLYTVLIKNLIQLGINLWDFDLSTYIIRIEMILIQI